MTTRMILPRPSTFSRYFVKPMYLQNIKPRFQYKNQQIVANKTGKFGKMQKRSYSMPSPREPNNGPPLWALLVTGIYVVYNIHNQPKKEN
jgi:hypothetical protein